MHIPNIDIHLKLTLLLKNINTKLFFLPTNVVLVFRKACRLLYCNV